MTGHPTKSTITQADLDAWDNCAVPDCDNKVTHDSDKCYPHTFGWEAVRRNLRERLSGASTEKEKDIIRKEIVKIANMG